MPDETGKRTTRSEAPSADESLRGETADDAVAAVVEEEDSKCKTAQDPQGSDDAEEQAGQPEDLKVVVSIKGGRTTIGVQRPSSDPHIESFDEGDLTGLAQETLAVVERARARWEGNHKHPAHVRPDPPAGRRGRRGQGEAQDATGSAEEAQSQQQTLRLF